MKDNNWYVEHKTKDADGHEGLSYHGPYVTRALAVTKRDDIWDEADTYSVTTVSYTHLTLPTTPYV